MVWFLDLSVSHSHELGFVVIYEQEWGLTKVKILVGEKIQIDYCDKDLLSIMKELYSYWNHEMQIYEEKIRWSFDDIFISAWMNFFVMFENFY